MSIHRIVRYGATLALGLTVGHTAQAQAAAPANAEAPDPVCPSSFKWDKAGAQCARDPAAPRSAEGDYVGDCFKFHAKPEPVALQGIAGGQTLVVIGQEKNAGDPLLRLARADRSRWWCKAENGSRTYAVKASEVLDSGADRSGWTYGLLSMPYKYYPKGREIAQGAPIGPYFGRRWGQPGSAVTVAGAFTLGSVRGEERDKASGLIVATPSLHALSLAAGVMWDITKNPTGRPFKVGVFFGADRASAGDQVKFPQSGKPWVAIQIGYDFTDH
jgi:hypothetical protein